MMRELSLNILDVAQNSISAKADLIEISVVANRADDLLSIMIKDNGCGMTPEQVNSVTSPFYTTRTTRRVGLGIPLFKMAAEMTGGALKIESKVGVGTTVKADFGYSHIDRMPLGDMCSTMITLIKMNPSIDFIYFEQLDDAQMTLDTRKIREILQGVPIDEPEVIKWIKEFITDGSPFLK